MKITTVITATERYLHATDILIRRLKANYEDMSGHKHYLCVVTDKSDQANDCINKIIERVDRLAEIQPLQLELDDGKKPYDESAQLMIAQLENAGFEQARDNGSDACWVVEPDVLPPPNALRCLVDATTFDGGYYGVAQVTYASQGGGSFMGGRGTPERWILPDIYEDERKLSKELQERREAVEKKAQSEHGKRGKLTKKTEAEIKKVREEIEKSPPKEGNIFALQAQGWRRRGWLNMAYPAVGRGAILPVDWVGMGCTLIGKRALSLAHFEGYAGRGTQDLFLCWKRWNPNGIKIACITHIACEHIVRHNNRENESFDQLYLIAPEYAEGGECDGHIRMRVEPYYTWEAGEDVKAS